MVTFTQHNTMQQRKKPQTTATHNPNGTGAGDEREHVGNAFHVRFKDRKRGWGLAVGKGSEDSWRPGKDQCLDLGDCLCGCV